MLMTNPVFSAMPDDPIVAQPSTIVAPDAAPVVTTNPDTIAAPAPQGGHSPSAPVADPAQPAAQVTPDAPAQPNESQIDRSSILAEITGGRLKNEDDWKTFQSIETEAAELRASLSAMKAEKDGLTPLALKVNELVAAGEPLAKVQEFLRIQQLDVDAMTPVEAIKAQFQHQYPTLSPEAVEAFLADKGLLSLDDVPTPVMLARQAVEEKAAKEYLRQLKVDSSGSARQAQLQAAEAARQTMAAQWQQVPAPPALIEKVAAGDYVADYQLSAEAIQHGHQSAMAWATHTGVEINDQNKKQFGDIVRHFAIAHEAPKMLSFVAQDAFAKGKLAAQQALGAPPPPPVIAGQAPATAQQQRKMTFSS